MQIARLTPDEVKSMYEKHGAALAAYACSCGLDHASAEDVVQQLFLKMLGKKVFVPRAPLAYLYRATRNASLNLRRDRRRETDLNEAETWLVRPGGNRNDILQLQRALKDLPDEQRETVFLKVWAGMTLLEIAELTETPLNTVASRYRYALEKLRERLGEHSQKRQRVRPFRPGTLPAWSAAPNAVTCVNSVTGKEFCGNREPQG